jgi:hypothetical protein
MNLPTSPARETDELCNRLSRDAFEASGRPCPEFPGHGFFAMRRNKKNHSEWQTLIAVYCADRIIAIRTAQLSAQGVGV